MKRIGRALRVGFAWVYGGDGESSHTSAVLASYHHPASITWRWALYWNRPSRGFAARRWVGPNGHGFISISSPLSGLYFSWQPHCWRPAE